MENINESTTVEFLLQGISEDPNMQMPLFLAFCLVYLLTLAGNIIIITLICLTPALHKPMYFFLCNLSFIDISYSTVTQPKLLSMLLTGNKAIAFPACISQFYFFITLTCAEILILTVMAYDRYVAICHPLTYPLLMNKKTYIVMAVAIWVISFLDPVAHTVSISHLTFCPPLLINHFYCDLSVVLKLSCKDTFLIDILTYLLGSMVGCCAFICIIISYSYIISTIMKIKSVEGKQKGFSTCVSHLIVVVLYYGTVLIIYSRPSSQYSSSKGKHFSMVYTALIPMVNPFIYTLRNRDVKNAFWKAIGNK
ncbi:hypothetical protein XELAEV_18040204mg [Xenopus laevis]|uniref:Olfactory receptor n=1 Tax=Xenopus laevis TaxID=8355 RepID=A0A974H927_XENLA|nr:hypothetical protein XELAEV_18040204mg [Xenopus laevis]